MNLNVLDAPEGPTHLPSLLGSVQLLLDFLQRGFLAGGCGHLQVGAAIKGGRLQDDFKGVSTGALTQLDHLHVTNVTQVQVHDNCCKMSRENVTETETSS